MVAPGVAVEIPPWVVGTAVVASGVTLGVLPAGTGVEASGVDTVMPRWVVEAGVAVGVLP